MNEKAININKGPDEGDTTNDDLQASSVDDVEEDMSYDSEQGSQDEDDGDSSSSGDTTEDYTEDENDRDDEEDDTQMQSGSSSSDEETERCPICLARFRDQNIGSPESCDHSFCLECIVEWSKNVNTCPVDRQVFHLILARQTFEGVVYKKISVQDHMLVVDEVAFDDTTQCEVCGGTDHEDRMLLCDSCDLGYHMACLTPVLTSVPRGMWYCPVCLPNMNIDQTAEQEVTISSDEEVIHPPRSRRWRMDDDEGIQIGRTLVRERVLRAITRIRGSTRVIESDSETEEEMQPTTSSGSSVKRRRTRVKTIRRKTRKRKTKRKAGSKTKTTTTRTNPKSGKKRKKRRKVRRKGKKGSTRARTKRLTPKSVKTRIADHLGLKSPPVGKSIPLVKGKQERNTFLNPDISTSSLNIMGDRNEMMQFSDESDVELQIEHHGPTVASRMSSYHRGPNPRLKRLHTGTSSSAAIRIPSPVCNLPFDLLGSIIDGQNLLMTESDKITIKRDGSLSMMKGSGNNKIRGDVPLHYHLQDGGSDGAQDGGSDGAQDGGSDGAQDGGSDGAQDGGSDGAQDGGSDGAQNGGSDEPGENHNASSEEPENTQNCASDEQHGGEDHGFGAPERGNDGGCEDSAAAQDGFGGHNPESLANEVNDEKTEETPKPDKSLSPNVTPQVNDCAQNKDNLELHEDVNRSENLVSAHIATEPSGSQKDGTNTCSSLSTTYTQECAAHTDSIQRPEELEGSIGSEEESETKEQPQDDATHKPCITATQEAFVKVSTTFDDSPVPSYLYSPEEPTSTPDDSIVVTMPAVDDTSTSEVADGGHTPLVDEPGLTNFEGDQTPTLDDEDSPDETNEAEEEVNEVENRATDNIHIVPFSELPRIPKIKKKSPETIRQEVDEDSNNSHASVLERLGLGDKQDSYPKWDKSKHDRNEKKRKSEDRDDMVREEGEKRSHHRDRYKDRQDGGDESGSRSRSRRHSSRDRDKSSEKSYEKSRDRERGYDRDRYHRSRSHDRSGKRSKSRDRERHTESDRRRRERSRERSRRSRSKSRSPHHREDRRQRVVNREESESSASKRFRLKRNFYNEFKDNQDDDDAYAESDKYKTQQKVAKSSSLDQFKPPHHQNSSRSPDTFNRHCRQTEDSVNNSGKPERDTRIIVDISGGHSEKSVHHSNEQLQRRGPNSQLDIPQIAPNRKHPPSPRSSEPDGLRIDGPPPPDLFAKSSVFKIPEGPPPRLNVPLPSHSLSEDLTYDPSQPTEPERSPPPQVSDLFEPKQLIGPGRISPLQARLQFGELMRPSHRGPLLADPGSHREPPPSHFVRMPDNIRQVIPPLPGFNVLQHNIHPRNVRPPLLMNPSLLGPPHLSRLSRMSGPPHLGWQAVSHPNVIIHNRIPIQVSQNGMPIHHSHPDSFLHPPPRLDRPSPQAMMENLATPPPPIPPKALEEMQQISQLLNAQAHLAHMASKGEQIIQFSEPPPILPDNGIPSTLQNRLSAEAKSVTFEEKMEVIDMDVASPSSDEIAMSFSPPPNDDGHVELDLNRTDRLGQRLELANFKYPLLDNIAKQEDLMPKSAAELGTNEKFLKKLNHQERVVEEVKLAIKPHYSKGRVDKEEYKEILRKAVPKICHSRSGDINPEKIRKYVEQYVEKVRQGRKTSSKSKPR